MSEHEPSTVETGYKNIVGSRKTCSYTRYVLIKGKINIGTYRNVSNENVLITGMFLYRDTDISLHDNTLHDISLQTFRYTTFRYCDISLHDSLLHDTSLLI